MRFFKSKIIFHLTLSLLVCCMFAATSCRKANSDITDTGTDSIGTGGKPNILILLADDMGYEVPACNGGQDYSTPNIDALAQSGRRFTQCHSSPMCSPSRFMLFTGKYNFRNYFLWGRMDRSNKTFANMLHDAGYITGYAGKWQLDGGDASIHGFGWDKYSVWLPYYVDREDEYGIRYKGAQIYQDGGYLPSSQTGNRYSEDEFTDYMLSFIDSASQTGKPFLAFYSMILPHVPFCPTPDDRAYGTWDFASGKSDPDYFYSMIAYEDKKIGQIINHLHEKNILNNTLVIFLADNGTSGKITSRFNGYDITGGKSETNEPGTNVPLIASWPGKIISSTVSDDVIDFTDFLPTLADAAEIPKPDDYGVLDGRSFLPALTGDEKTMVRNSIFDAYALNRYATEPYYTRWVQDGKYKLYDTGAFPQSGQFIKLNTCMPDGAPLNDAALTPEEKSLKENFQQALQSYK